MSIQTDNYYTLIKSFKSHLVRVNNVSAKLKIDLSRDNIYGGKLDVDVIDKKNKIIKHKIIVFGIYNIDNEQFIWKNNFNKHVLKHIKDYGKNILGPDKIIRNLCKSNVTI